MGRRRNIVSQSRKLSVKLYGSFVDVERFTVYKVTIRTGLVEEKLFKYKLMIMTINTILYITITLYNHDNN